MTDNQYETVLDAIHAAGEQGYRFGFIPETRGLRCVETGDFFSPDQFVIDAFHRVEGATDPAENAIVYLVKTTTGVKGILVDSFGMYANADISSLIKVIPINRNETAGGFDNKHCLNCGTVLQGHYCYYCGQKDEPLREPIYVMLGHAIAHYWHFDGKFINTLAPLLLKPGFLSKEFMEGKRVRYVHPVQLYFFNSIVFFIAFSFLTSGKLRSTFEDGSFFTLDSVVKTTDSKMEKEDLPLLSSNSESADSSALAHATTIRTDSNLFPLIVQEVSPADETTIIKIDNTGKPVSITAYNDSVNALLPENKPGKMQQAFDRLIIRLNSMDREQAMERFAENVTHNLPKLMFVLIPVFALLLKLIFIRRKIYFVDHAVFTLHFHAFVFFVMLLLLLVYFVIGFVLPVGWLLLLMMIYLILAMKFFYRLSGFKVLLKFISLSVLYFFSALMAVVLFLMVALITV